MGRHHKGRKAKEKNEWQQESKARRKCKQQELKQATKLRVAGLKELKKYGVSVYKEEDERELETVQERGAWGRIARRHLLSRGPGFRVTPEGIGDSDKNIGILRAMISMTTKIRWGLKHDRFGKEASEIDRWEKSLGVEEGVYKRVGRAKCDTEEEWSSRWEEEKRKGVSSWGYVNREYKTADIPGCVERIEAFGKEWLVEDAPSFLAQQTQSAGGESRKRKQCPDNLPIEEYQEYLELKKDAAEMRLERADKGGSAVYISRKMWKRLAREHVADHKTYVRANKFGDELRERDSVLGARWFEGALMPNGLRAQWRNTHDFLVPDRQASSGGIPQRTEPPRGEWGSEEEVQTSLYARMEYFLTTIVEKEYRLPDDIIADLTNRMRPTKGGNSGGRWGMGGENIHRRGKIEAVALEPILKLHKPPPLKSKPVGRGHASQMKVWENIVAAFLVVVLDERESEREGRGEEPTVLRDSRILVEELEKINERWEEEYRKNEKQEEEIMIASWDIAAMYP